MRRTEHPLLNIKMIAMGHHPAKPFQMAQTQANLSVCSISAHIPSCLAWQQDVGNTNIVFASTTYLNRFLDGGVLRFHENTEKSWRQFALPYDTLEHGRGQAFWGCMFTLNSI